MLLLTLADIVPSFSTLTRYRRNGQWKFSIGHLMDSPMTRFQSITPNLLVRFAVTDPDGHIITFAERVNTD